MALDRTIDLVADALQSIGRPAGSREIVDFAKDNPNLKRIANGRTPHKTINARIALDILKNGAKSRFYRYAPAAYGLRSLAENGVYGCRYRSEFKAPNRRKQIAKEKVAAVLSCDLRFMLQDGMYDGEFYPLSTLALLEVRYFDRQAAEIREDLKQLVSYVYICYKDHVIAFERGSYSADGGEFLGKQSIGFGGHLNEDDLNLFDTKSFGLFSNIERELYEELYILRDRISPIIESVRFKGFLKDSTTSNGRRHLALVAEVCLREKVELYNSGLGIRNLRWISAVGTPNCFYNFEIWSQYLFRFLQEENEHIAF